MESLDWYKRNSDENSGNDDSDEEAKMLAKVKESEGGKGMSDE